VAKYPCISFRAVKSAKSWAKRLPYLELGLVGIVWLLPEIFENRLRFSIEERVG
jgi:hypothetical protein